MSVAPAVILTAVLTSTPVHGVPPRIPDNKFAIDIPKTSFLALKRVPVKLSAILAEIRVSKTATNDTYIEPITIFIVGMEVFFIYVKSIKDG